MKNFVQRIYLLCLFMAFSGLTMAADIPNNTIYYTSTNWIIDPWNRYNFGAKIISNTYDDGQGVITFDNNVTSIGDYAFNARSYLSSIQIPNSVTSIGKEAFYNCINLTSVHVSNSVTSIGEAAFQGCYSLTSINIPNSVTNIKSGAFKGCSKLSSITIPSSVTNIEGVAFSDCSKLNSVTCLATTPPSLGSYPFSVYGTLHVLPGCKSAYENAEYWKDFTIVEDAEYDPNRTIFYTSSDEKIITPVYKDVFGANIVSNIYENGKGTIVFDGDVTSIGFRAFFGRSGLTSITIPNSVTSIGESAFTSCSLTSITIPNSVTSIGLAAFAGCSNLTSINIPNSVTSIGESAFSGCSGLTSITIPNSVTSIKKETFQFCSSLSSITIPNSMIYIESYAFDRCSKLKSITIPNSVTSIGAYAFRDCLSLTSITIPNSVTSIGVVAFSGCTGLTSITVENGNIVYDSRDNCNAIIETATNTLIKGIQNTIIPNSVTSIGSSAFYNCSSLTSITIPDGVTSIGSSAFSRCSSLTSITIPNSVTSIGYDAFSSCSSLTSITIPDGVTSIGESAFRYCSGLTSITIPNSVTNIGNYVFDGCSKLTSITNLSSTPQRIFYSTFSKYGTLHVLPGCKEAYQNADYWKKFTIVEDAVDPSASIELADGMTYNEGTTQENKDITYTRTFNNTSWQALYIPFSMSYDDWKDDFEVAFINSVRQYDNDEDGVVDETIMDVMKIKSGSLIPNTPYLIKAKSVGEKTITMNNATLYQAEKNSIECSTMLAKYTFTGTYSTISASTMSANNYYAMGGGSLIMTDGTSDLKPFRWYLNIESRSPMYSVSNAAKTITINVVGEEEATGISQMSSDREHSSAIYDLNGRKMSQKNLKSGLYIKNGKKIIIK